jgi:hypothetical protein
MSKYLPVDQPSEAEPDQWTAKYEADDGTVVYGDAAIAAMLSHGLQAQERHRRAVEALTPLQRHTYERHLLRRRPARKVAGNVLLFPQPREVRARQRRRREQAARSSAKSGDSGSDDGESEPAADWHWATPPSWQGFVRSIRSGDFEQEIARERNAGYGR